MNRRAAGVHATPDVVDFDERSGRRVINADRKTQESSNP